MNYIKKYYNEITKGNIVVSKKVSLQVEALMKLLKECENKNSKWQYSNQLGSLPIIFIETFCRHSKGKFSGKRFKLELWQKVILQSTFGFVNRITGFRKHKELLVIVARKNGKTTLAAGLALFMFLADGEGGSQVYCCANKKDQAKLLYSEGVNMINQSKELRGLVKRVREKLITKEHTNLFATFEALSNASDTLDGLNIHLGVLDEIHSYRNRDVYDVIKQGMSARDQPLLAQITTSGMIREGIYDEQYDYSEKVLSGIIDDDEFLTFVYEQDNINEINEPDMWVKSNPNIGVSKKIDYIKQVIENGKNKPGYMPTVLTKDFNIPTSSSENWLDLKYLDYKYKYNLEDLKNNYYIGGVDLSNTTDLSCGTILLVKKETPELKYVIQKYWMPADKFDEKMATDKVPYNIWVDQGWIDLCAGNIVQFSDCTKWFKKMLEEFELYPAWIGYDSWNTGYWLQDMEKNGFPASIMKPVIQGPKSFSYAMDLLKTDLEGGKLNYNCNPVLRWCLSNVVVKRDGNDNKGPDKLKSKNRIDGAVSLLDAYAVLINEFDNYYNFQNI